MNLILKPMLVIVGLLLPLLSFNEAHSLEWVTFEKCYAQISEDPYAGFGKERFQSLVQEAATIENSRGRFWRITAKNGQVSHLWGTMHSSHPQILKIPKAVEDVIQNATTIALEREPWLKNSLELAYVAKSDWMFDYNTERKTIELPSNIKWMPPEVIKFPYTIFDAEIGAWVRARFSSRGVAGFEDNLSNAGLADLLMYHPCEDFPNGQIPIQDNRIAMLGAINGAEIIGLEYLTAFENYLNQKENEDVAFAIANTYALYFNPKFFSPSYGDIYALYKRGLNGEMIVLEQQEVAEHFGTDRGRELLAFTDGYLLVKRNNDFLENMLPHLEVGNSFTAVGSFHLPGENGLITMLRKAGYIVERIATVGED